MVQRSQNSAVALAAAKASEFAKLSAADVGSAAALEMDPAQKTAAAVIHRCPPPLLLQAAAAAEATAALVAALAAAPGAALGADDCIVNNDITIYNSIFITINYRIPSSFTIIIN